MLYKTARVLVVIGAVAMLVSSVSQPHMADYLLRFGMFIECVAIILAFVDLLDHCRAKKPAAPLAYEITHAKSDGTIVTPDYYVTYPGVIATKPLGHFEFVGDGVDVNGKPTRIWKRRS